jgi:diguanylate cyclase (GGDEF)-like protein/PAS domain S-box-containing protein
LQRRIVGADFFHNTMTLKRKVWLWLLLSAMLIVTVDLTISYLKLHQEMRTETEYDARTIYGFMMATRRIYQEQFIHSGLPVNNMTVGFLPAHSFSRIAKDFAHWNDSGILFNNVSDRPRNPDNQADTDELTAIGWFRANPKETERVDNVVHPDGKTYLLYSAPIWIEPFCLKCHGTQENAPQSIREGYDAAYGYKIGDLRGLVSIKIPTEKFERRFQEIWIGQLVKSVAGYSLLMLVIGLFIDRVITVRLHRLQAGAERIAAGDYAARLCPSSNDEICQVANSFNRMADEVQSREQMLGKLSLAIDQSPESVVITDLAGRIEYVNDCFTRNTGYSREEVLGKNPNLLQSGKTSRENYAALWTNLQAGTGWSGEFTNRRKDGSEYVESVRISPVRAKDGTITHYLAVKQDITEKKRTEAQIHHLAYYDSLTNLANRRLFNDRLGQSIAVAQRQQHLDALLLLNLDRFKNLNDAHGHASGDLLLVAVGGRLASLLREGDSLARLASDEFAILLQDLGHAREHASRRALAVAEKIHTSLQLPFHIDDDDIVITASLGITLCPDDEGDSPQDALRRADTALHRAKDAGGNQSAFFEDDMAVAARQHHRTRTAPWHPTGRAAPLPATAGRPCWPGRRCRSTGALAASRARPVATGHLHRHCRRIRPDRRPRRLGSVGVLSVDGT